MDKSFVFSGKEFIYQMIKIPIKKNQCIKLANEINSSGFWKLPYNIECDYPPADGYGFTLEVNTKKKYKLVGAGSCPSDQTNFAQTCQKIIELARMEMKSF